MIALSKRRMLFLAVLVILMALVLTLFSMAHAGLLGYQASFLTHPSLAWTYGH